jgi:hypothetical protein
MIQYLVQYNVYNHVELRSGAGRRQHVGGCRLYAMNWNGTVGNAVTYHRHRRVSVVRVGYHILIGLLPRMKKLFNNSIPCCSLAPHIQWLLGFEWRDVFYKETCRPFGLCTAPFIFNLFAEVFHWILQSWLHWDLLHREKEKA